MRSKDKNLMEKIREFVDDYTKASFGKPPTNRDIGAEFDMSHVSAYRYLQAMNDLGMLVYEDGEIHTELIDRYKTEFRTCARLDARVPAGTPDMVDDAYVEEYFPIPAALVNGERGNFYMIQVKGESMISAGIEEGDQVIFREECCPKNDDIVIAYVPNEGNTLKRYRKERGRKPFLWAENEKWSDADRNFGDRFTVIGVVVKVLKDV